jgi:hypothetical protein|tara:strand:- start:125 stop:418 length:294 start_codon:yes stop_codon:yes gene_type:complete
MPNDLLRLLNLPTQNTNTEMDNQNHDNTNINWQGDLLGWVYSNTLESVLLTWLTNNSMSKSDLARVLVSVISNKPNNQSTDATSQVLEKLTRLINQQ